MCIYVLKCKYLQLNFYIENVCHIKNSAYICKVIENVTYYSCFDEKSGEEWCEEYWGESLFAGNHDEDLCSIMKA